MNNNFSTHKAYSTLNYLMIKTCVLTDSDFSPYGKETVLSLVAKLHMRVFFFFFFMDNSGIYFFISQ